MEVTKTTIVRGFGWLNATQFLGALNDNVFKLLVVFYLVGKEGPDRAAAVTATAGAVFVVPFLIFSAWAGMVADRFSKRDIVRWAKAAEVMIMAAGCVALATGGEWMLWAVLFMTGVHSAFFAPAKYGIVPELVEREQLSRANGLLEALTYLAIVFGTALGPGLVWLTGERYVLMGATCVGIALAGLATSMGIGRTPAAGNRQKASIFFLRDIWRTIWGIRADKDLLLAVVAGAYFLLVGGYIYSNLIPYGMKHLELTKEQSGYLFVVAAVGIGLGSLAAGKLSGRNVEFGIVPMGAMGMTAASLGLGLAGGGLYGTLAWVVLMGASAGLFIVPLNAFIQLRSPAQKRGEVLAASGFLGWLGVLISSGLIAFFNGVLGLSAEGMFTALGLMTAALTVWAVWTLPDFMMRLPLVLLTRIIYRVKVRGIENLPMEGGVLIVANHVSWADPFLLGSTMQRRIRFLMDKEFYEKWWLKPIAKLMRAIPISSTDQPKKIMASLIEARKALDEGYVVCIFAEGALTRTGVMREFRAGFEKIAKGKEYKILPAYIGGVWGSVFSYYDGKVLSRLPRRLGHPVGIYFGEMMEGGATAFQIRSKVTQLSCEYFADMKGPGMSLARKFVKTARSRWGARCVSDQTGRRLTFGETLTGSVLLAGELEKATAGQQMVGVLLPPSAGAVVANAAIAIMGKTAVNLNYVTGEASRKAAIEQCGLRCIITSSKFIEKVDSAGSPQAGIKEKIEGAVMLEDMLAAATKRQKARAYIKARFLPAGVLCRGDSQNGDAPATVIFSSGSSGRPKGVILSHHNILANIEGVRMVVRLGDGDNLCGVAPFFHSFGYTCGLWLPLISGCSAGYVANPLDGKAVGQSVRENGSTVLFAPPTFLLNYLRRAEAADFATLRIVVGGAEKLKESLAEAFVEKFGVRPLEGYGATELSPVVTVNVPDVESDGVYQVGNKIGAAGHPIPGVAVKVLDIESGNEVGPGVEGVLWVKGPNVMCGYLQGKSNIKYQNEKIQTQDKSFAISIDERATGEVMKDGWYNTGDVAKVDEDGFVTITDRVSRFSKIGGEMVPHGAVEDALLAGLGTDERVVMVVGVPDEKKGEELVVVFCEKAGTAEGLHEIVSKSSLPNMWRPGKNAYMKVEAIPLLGSGKVDMAAVKRIAGERKRSPQIHTD
jgi:acyl-[acyl-carrier-protein]-phospholipid O-acyltransferase/long-chain-fatty-acid--[acyl-carrier-protein] ligase